MIKQLFNTQLLYNPIYFRYSFFILLPFSVIFNCLIPDNVGNFYILFIFCVIFLGIGFYNKPLWFLLMLTVVAVTCRYYSISDSTSNFGIYLIHLLTYFIIALISSGLMKNIQKVEKDNLINNCTRECFKF